MELAIDCWDVARTLILSDERSSRARPRAHHDRLFVSTPLDMIAHLEMLPVRIATIVLAGRFGGDRELASFLLESYPAVRIVDGVSRNEL